ncbi:reverse transcriptase domain-containing protein [Tanacetum coccineum]
MLSPASIIQSGIDDLSSENMHVAAVQHGNKSGVDANNLPKPFANMLKHERITKKINFCSLSNEENVVNSNVVLPKHAKEEVMSRYENTLVRYFVGKSIAFPLVQNYVNNSWIKFGLHKVMRTDNGVFLFKFSSSMGIDQVLERCPWLIQKSPIILIKWSPSFPLKKCEVTKVPVWVKLHNVPILAYSDVGLSLIATKIGKPIMLDGFTSSMCVESWGRIGFARALIEVSAESILKNEVVMAIRDEEGDGHSREVIRVEYEWKPPHCVECKCFGHDSTTCPKRVREAAPKDPTRDSKSTSVEENEYGFVQVKSQKKKKNISQGSGINLSKCNPNFQYRPVSKPGKGKGETSKEATGHKKGSVNEKMVDTTRSTWNEDLESDDEVDEDIFPDGNKWDDQFDIRLKGRSVDENTQCSYPDEYPKLSRATARSEM